MDVSLLAWARAVKARRRPPLPPLWLFTDELRLADPREAVARLPRGLAGVVFRHDGVADRVQLGRALARVCRERRVAFVVAGDVWLARELRAGLHLRRGERQAGPPRPRLLTASAHDRRELVRAHRAGAALIFLGPAFATASHPGVRPLGAVRWNVLARAARGPVGGIGGMRGGTVRRLRWAVAVGAIEALG